MGIISDSALLFSRELPHLATGTDSNHVHVTKIELYFIQPYVIAREPVLFANGMCLVGENSILVIVYRKRPSFMIKTTDAP